MVEIFEIVGGNRLNGEVNISGAKNAALALLPACLLAEEGVCKIENLPDIQDVTYILDIMKKLGCKIKRLDDNTVSVDSSSINSHVATYQMVTRMRASYYLVGALLGRFNNAEVAMPGGCNFGQRPVDLHKKGFEHLGAKVTIASSFKAQADNLVGSNIFLDTVSVGATINIMISSVRAQGMTTIENAAKEPHVVDVANFLNSMGANVKGAGTDTIRIKGVSKLRGSTYTMIPDQVEAGTFMFAVAGCGGDVVIKNVIPKHLEAITAKLEEMGVKVEENGESVRVISSGILNAVNLKTQPYPGFPTDLQPIVTSVLTMAYGTSTINESVWNSRFQYVDELRRLGANILINGSLAVVSGVKRLSGTYVASTDLRAGAGMVIAGMMAEGTTQVGSIHYIDRGYEHFEQKITKLGGKIKRIKVREG